MRAKASAGRDATRVGLEEYQREAEAANAAGAVQTAAAPRAIPERTRPPGLRDQGPRRREASSERAPEARSSAPGGPLPPLTRQLFREPGA